ncbi:hypothetical protein [Halonotius roseus]|uniref:Uncharacterized protein n=1 Tax=Halonotius roseus TaxID=2511997 RepID=A0A544QQR6_9EURY|nr:hypothetical protein [Halonotius roseus]TQQ81787.1 hypothetical protein EWF95_02305 [Halonotius roseus]
MKPKSAGLCVAVLVLVVTAGCLAGGNTATDSLVSTNERCLTDQVPNRSTVTDTEVLNFTPYPEPPTVVNRTSVTNFVKAVERAYEGNRLLVQTESVQLSSANVTVTATNTTQQVEGYSVDVKTHISFQSSAGIGMTVSRVTYFVNETTLRRQPGGGTAGDGVVIAKC